MPDERRRPTCPLEPVPFFKTLVRAVGGECQTETAIVGASGLEHPCFAIGYDRPNNRLIAVSADLDARTAALAHADVASAFSPGGVLFAQPALHDPNVRFETIEQGAGWTKIDTIGWSEAWARTELAFGKAGFYYLMTQGTRFFFDGGRAEEELARQYGVCPIPLRGFSHDDVELFREGADLEQVREVLRREGILQYFFPSPGHLALGLADRAPLDARRLQEQLVLAPQLGHPLGRDEIVGTFR